ARARATGEVVPGVSHAPRESRAAPKDTEGPHVVVDLADHVLDAGVKICRSDSVRTISAVLPIDSPPGSPVRISARSLLVGPTEQHAPRHRTAPDGAAVVVELPVRRLTAGSPVIGPAHGFPSLAMGGGDRAPMGIERRPESVGVAGPVLLPVLDLRHRDRLSRFATFDPVLDARRLTVVVDRTWRGCDQAADAPAQLGQVMRQPLG